MEFIFKNQNNTILNDYKLENINKFFKLPIMYLDNKLELKENINEDLELYSNSQDESKLYEITFNPVNPYSKILIKEWAKYYTYDVEYLKESQILLDKINKHSSANNLEIVNSKSNLQCWNDVKQETSFKERYQYIDWKYFKNFNESSYFLQILSIYNMSSPIFSLVIPILMLILPFFILKIQGIRITLSKYYDVLKMVFSNHSLGKIFTNFSDISWSQRFYILLSIGLYLFQIYQNVLTCIRFHNNLKLIHGYFHEIKNYIDFTLERYDLFLSMTNELKSYNEFNSHLISNRDVLKDFRENLHIIGKYDYNSYFKVGYLMKWFYKFYYKNDINNCFMYSFGFNGYMDNLYGVCKNIKENKINFCNYNTKNKVSFKSAYYAPLVDKSPVKNTYSVNKNISITGPNASGKTTLLKTTLFNIILSQQIGCGFYKSANIMPYHYLHCYLNIPDTSGRDSLFQAEARRCKEIIESIENSDSKNRHFCIFDELYSGTNPYEAVASAFAFIKYLKQKNINFILTTHYINLCESVERNKLCNNYKMDIDILENSEFKYSYKLSQGISNIKGGVKVLRELDYPENIIEDAKVYLDNN
tara:strand:+ start:8455 stop:10221 length:1767 start_codon:yes stop_codon:yes gene_type:complete